MNATMLTRDERIDFIIARDGLRCFFPGCTKELKREDITFDHWIPQALGGTWDMENLRLMHKRCNAVKGDRLPNEDGTLPPLKREVSLANRRAVRRGIRAEVCTDCNSGRDLGPDDVCNTCESGPMPPTFPRWAKMTPKECTHEGPWWCWACSIGIIERQPAIVDVLDGGDIED